MNAPEFSVPVSTMRSFEGDEEDVVKGFGTAWDKLHLRELGFRALGDEKKGGIPQNKRWIFPSCSIRRVRVL